MRYPVRQMEAGIADCWAAIYSLISLTSAS